MATAIVRSGLRAALRGSASRSTPASKRTFSSASDPIEEAREAAKWEKISYVAIVSCTIFGIFILSKGHHHYDEPPPYSYLHIRSKEFPWGPNGLFEVKEEH